jgi:hypothetical protein
VRGALDDRVIGMTLDGAVRGKWINTLVTDQYTAERLVKAQPGKTRLSRRSSLKKLSFSAWALTGSDKGLSIPLHNLI